MLKRYRLLDMPAEMDEYTTGEWVRYDDVTSAVMEIGLIAGSGNLSYESSESARRRFRQIQGLLYQLLYPNPRESA